MRSFFLPEATSDTAFIALGSLWPPVLLWLAVVNLAAFAMMGADKRRAKKPGARRIPEKVLFLTAALGGSVGVIIGMYRFRHKTRHWYFMVGMPVILLLQIAACILLLR